MKKSILYLLLIACLVLVSAGCSNESEPNDESSPLHNAIKSGELTDVKEVLATGVNPNTIHDQKTALILATENGDLSMIKLLIQAGADVNKFEHEDERIPLMLALEDDNIDLVKLLIAKGANVNATDSKGQTPIWYALESNDPALLQLLIQHKAKVNVADLTGNTPLHKVMSDRVDPVMISPLLAAGLNPNLKNADHYTALQTGVSQRNIASIKELLKFKQVDVNLPNKYGERLIYRAISNKDRILLETLLQAGANLKIPDDLSKQTPLGAAAKDGYIAGVELILKAGADINERDANGQTALMHAVQGNHIEVVQLLLKNKADPTIQNPTSKETAAEIAKQRGYQELFNLLNKATKK